VKLSPLACEGSSGAPEGAGALMKDSGMMAKSVLQTEEEGEKFQQEEVAFRLGAVPIKLSLQYLSFYSNFDEFQPHSSERSQLCGILHVPECRLDRQEQVPAHSLEF